jgi:hypothetical protein
MLKIGQFMTGLMIGAKAIGFRVEKRVNFIAFYSSKSDV